MVCIYCGAKTQVINSRLQKQANSIWRRRTCQNCGSIFTTHETADLSSSFVVRISRKDIRPFHKDALFISVYESLKHRESALEDARALLQTIIGHLIPTADHGQLTPEVIAVITHEVIERFDQTAGTVYAAYHKRSLRR